MDVAKPRSDTADGQAEYTAESAEILLGKLRGPPSLNRSHPDRSASLDVEIAYISANLVAADWSILRFGWHEAHL